MSGPADPLACLADGEMVRRVREFAWERTGLGPAAGWPPSLVTAVRTLLACRLPMYLAWGPEFTQVYNDAYRPILGDKHPALGQGAPQTWGEIWPTIGPMWEEVRQGRSIGFDDFKLTIDRYGYAEDCWFNFSYSPVFGDNAEVAGILVTFAETTEKVKAVGALGAERRNLQLALDAASMGWWRYDPAQDYARWDDRFKAIFGMPQGESPNDVPMSRIHAEDRALVSAAVEASLDPARRSHFSVEYRILHPETGIKWIEAHGIAEFADGGQGEPATGLVGTVSDITERRRAQAALREGERQARAAAERLALALRAAQMGDWSWAADTDIVTCSERAARIFGIPAGPHLTWSAMRDILHPEDRERARLAVERAARERDDYDIEYRISVAGELRWVMARGRALYAPDGATSGMIGVVQDVSERKRLEGALEARTRTLEMLLKTAGVISGELQVDKVVQAVTDAATQVTGAQFGAFFYNVADANGGSYMLYALSGVDRSHFERFPMPRATALFGATFRGEGVIRSGDVRAEPRYGQFGPYHGMPPGHLPVVSYLAVPVVSRSGEVLGGLFFGHGTADMFTAAHESAVLGLASQAAVAIDNSRLHERARASLEVAESASRMKDDFLATVSHELRTPLSSLVGWVHLLRAGRLPPSDLQRALDSIDRSVKAQQQIIGDILDVSRIVTGKLRMDLSPIEVVAAIEGAAETLGPLLQSKRIELTQASDGSLLVLGDPNRLQQVVWNLLSNAIKYTPRGGKIRVSLRRVESSAELRIADNGEGIDPAFLPHVFERFRQADSSTTRVHGGIGLGLAIVRHLVQLHGGTVEAHSAGFGKGSEFVVRLPLAPAGEVASRDNPRGDPAQAHMPEARDLLGLRLLVVDDEHDTRVMLAAVLGSAGAVVRTAASAMEALAMLGEELPQAIVSDIGMPKEDGLWLIRRVRERGVGIPAIALTAYARAEDRVGALNAGFQAHLAKPADPVELIATVASLVGRKAG